MNKWIWVSLILLALIIGGIIAERVVHDNKKNALINEQAILIKHYQNAKIRVDTVHDTIRSPGIVIIKPVAVQEYVHDTVKVIERKFAYDSIFNKNGIRFRWLAKGNLDFIGFSDFTWPKEIITITKQVDTCIIDYKAPLLRYGPYAGLSINSFTSFPGLEVGGQILIKDQLSFSVGCLYLNGLYANVRFGYLLSK